MRGIDYLVNNIGTTYQGNLDIMDAEIFFVVGTM